MRGIFGPVAEPESPIHYQAKGAPSATSTFWMSAENFVVETLTFPGVSPRGHPRVTQSPNDRLEIVVNRYSPKINPNPKTGDVTLILLHANGFHKVCPQVIEAD